ncbi:hypothetical protein [Sulfuriroseicoccus oceanibius]|uniref:Uncharacterized protein n=1 Tax=Sulfuriroseicoccus oceanibius TaxID=2707525 RepID=A0A6B3L3J6_9BACT|nr:hypothetical protein [Sulfuriroseicoccus oceanibius]QQL46020.1 hypothetical protein G3M56_005420 [Sulfuriroseicoccus oceanibius]
MSDLLLRGFVAFGGLKLEDSNSFRGVHFSGARSDELKQLESLVFDALQASKFCRTLLGKGSLNVVWVSIPVRAKVDPDFVFLWNGIDKVDPDGLFWAVVEGLVYQRWIRMGVKHRSKAISRVRAYVLRKAGWELK